MKQKKLMGGGNVHDSMAHRQEPDKKRVRGITSGYTVSPISMAPSEPQRLAVPMRTLSVEEQIAIMRPSAAVGFAAHMHHWFLAGAALGVIVALVSWHPVPLMIAAFLGLVGLSEQWAGPNIVAAIAAYDSGTSSSGQVSITISCWDTDNHYHATVRQQGWPDWEYEFVPQGWLPSVNNYKARIWRDGTSGRPVLTVVDKGILIPRYRPKQISGSSDRANIRGH